MGIALKAITGAAWAILPDQLEIMRAIAARDDLKALGFEDGKPLQKTRKPAEIFGSVAVVNCTGPMFRYANLMTDFCGATSTEELIKDLITVADSPQVKSIVLNFDTPGGEAKSISEAAEYIAMIMATTGKPITAYVDGNACSAGYWLASQCKEIVISKTGFVGSIGAVVGFDKPKSAEEKDHIELVSSRSKNKRPDLSTDEGVSEIQAQIDALADVFIADAASGRGMSEDDLMTACNAGGVKIGAQAVASGLADRTGTLKGLIAELNETPDQSKKPTQKTNPTRGPKMTFKTLAEMQTAAPDLYADLMAEAQANAETSQAEAKAEGMKLGVTQERERVASIVAAESLGHDELKNKALIEGMDAGAFALSVTQAEASNKTEFLKGAKTPAQNIEPDADAQDQADAKLKAKSSAKTLTPKQLTAKANDYIAAEKSEGRTVTFKAAIKLASNGEI